MILLCPVLVTSANNLVTRSRLRSGKGDCRQLCLIILVGTLLLMLPISSKVGGASFIDALFTTTSATCVTGLVVGDTYTLWTPSVKG